MPALLQMLHQLAVVQKAARDLVETPIDDQCNMHGAILVSRLRKSEALGAYPKASIGQFSFQFLEIAPGQGFASILPVFSNVRADSRQVCVTARLAPAAPWLTFTRLK